MIAPPRQDIPRLDQQELRFATDRLVLRPLAAGDVEAMWPIVSDPEFPKLMSWGAHRDRDETASFVQRCADELARNTDVTWAILVGDRLVGTISISFIQWQVGAWRRDRGEVGYWIAPADQKQGYATEATLAVMGFGFEVLGLHKLTIGCIVGNTASKRVIEKVGFRYVTQIDEDLWRDDRWFSHLRYELTFNEWSDVSTTLRFSKPRRP